jgi:hypothetical protein
MATPHRKRMTVSGMAWTALIAAPPVIIIGLMIAVFTWQSRTGSVTPKWRKAKPASVAASTNAVPAQPAAGPAMAK